MESLILFRRPRKISRSKLSEYDNYVYKPRKSTTSTNKANSYLDRHLPILKSVAFSSSGVRLNIMNEHKNKRHAVDKYLVNNAFGCLSIKGSMSSKKFDEREKTAGTNDNNVQYQYPMEITKRSPTKKTHNLQQLKPTFITGSFSGKHFDDILQTLPKPIKRTPLYHGLILIARELRNVLTRTIDTDIICSIERLPRDFQQSTAKHQVNYAINIKEKINHNEMIWYDFSEDSIMRLSRFPKNFKSNKCHETTCIRPEQVKLLDSYNSGGNSVSLEACQLKYLPDLSAFYMTLRSLNLSGNYLEDLPSDFCLLNNLEFLSLRFNPLRKVPESMVKLKKLKSLDLSYCLIENLTFQFFDLKSLEQLDLSHNRLAYLDSRIEKLEHLKVLKLNGNDLIGIPPGLLCLCEKTLESLDLNNNPMLWLFPEEIKNNSSVDIQSLKVLTSLKMRDILHKTSRKNQETFSQKPEQYIIITSTEEDNPNFFEFRKVDDEEEPTLLSKLLTPIGSCCWCRLDRYDQKNTICMHCVDVFNYSSVPICMLCCRIQCLREVRQCSTPEQFAKRYYKSCQNYTNK
ncbi:unnamed protein product [Schistosoma turkestanicum]|nr:unnamed protein product [Schistosoma turkestanicum]